MRRLAVLLALFFIPATPALAKKRPKGKSAAEAKKTEEEKLPPPNDKRTNEGAQGRMNSTEDAARAAEGPGGAGRVP